MTILDVLENVEYNLENVSRLGIALLPLAQEQLHVALVLLQKGYDAETEVSLFLEQYEDITTVPEAEEE